ncbi:MAG: RNA polymerase sigma factor [Actinomycetota bacterium]|nr:RNA polymerase sigma factor [Actinomycetota bacterium]
MKQPFEHVVAQHAATVLRVCRFVAGPNDADDAWAETFISAMRAYPTLPPEANVQAWLVRIAHNRSIDIVRSRSTHASPSETLPHQDSTIGLPEAQDHEIWISVAQLPPKQRLAIAYHYLGGLPFKEIAEILGGTTESVRKASSDGIKALRASIIKNSAQEVTR